MKFPLLALPLVALLPTLAMAQTSSPSTAAAKVSTATIDPSATALLDRAAASYKGASGISYRVVQINKGQSSASSLIQFSPPNRLSISSEGEKAGQTMRVLVDGSDLYIVQGVSYRKLPAPPGFDLKAASPGSGALLAAMIEGQDPITALQSSYATAPFRNFKGNTVALGARVIDGDVFSGIQSTYSAVATQGTSNLSIKSQVTAWFGGSPLLLRRTQMTYTLNGKAVTFGEKILDQQISPTFADDAFKFNDSGLKLTAEAAPGQEQYWDARLKVGTNPFAFESKDLKGQPISLAAYKGKVVIMDFWATWCGPCVASLPELKGAYDKYHSQGLEVVGISLDEDKNALTSFIKARQMPWPQIFDGKGWQSRVPGVYGVKAIPFMLIIGKDGKIASVNPRGKIEDAVKAALAAS